MNFTFKIILISIFITLLSITTFSQQTNWQANYRGKPSFRLSDDPKISALRKELQTFRTQKKLLDRQITTLRNQIKGALIKQKTLERKLQQCNSNPTPTCEAEKTSIEAQIAAIKKANQQRNTKVQNLKASAQKISAQIEAKKSALSARRNQLITKILEFNQIGANGGRAAGRLEGLQIAKRRGRRFGIRFGREYGQRDGEREGRSRVRQEGFDKGTSVGSREGRSEGESDGVAEGTKQGNIIAASLAGRLDGGREAENSDAAEVGKTEGIEDGLKRAIYVGKEKGTNIGENEAITKYESQPLESVERQGAFSGAFTSNIPPFPINFKTGKHFNPSPPAANNPLFSKAYLDGYKFTYRRATRIVYRNRIEEIYNRHYKRSYDLTFNEFYNKSYPYVEKEGFDEGRKIAYDSIYPEIYQTYFERYKNRFSSNPNKYAFEYKNTYDTQKTQTYNQVYDEIKNKNYGISEQETYTQNIETQIEKYRLQRFREVSKIYENFPVIKFISSSTFDGGIQGIASNDGVFQPNEKIYYSIILVNYGKKVSSTISLTLENGQTYKIKPLKPQSKTRIKGIANGKIPRTSKDGSAFLEVLTLKSSVQSSDLVQVRHFDSSENGILKEEIIKFNVAYPIRIADIRLTDQLLLDQENTLTANVINKSNRSYEGQIKFEITDNALDKTIQSNWNTINQISVNQKMFLSNSGILVKNRKDTYKPLKYTIKVSKDGVTLGEYKHIFSTIAKSKYQNKGNDLPVIITDSKNSKEELFEVINKLGGRENVSILDVSLPKLNEKVLNSGIVNKSIVILNNKESDISYKIDHTLNNSLQSTILILNSDKQDLKNSSYLSKMTTIPFNLSGFETKDLFFTNPLITQNSKDVQIFISSDLQNLKVNKRLIDMLNLSADEHLTKILNTFDQASYFNPTPEQLLLAETYNAKMLGEILNIDLAYRKSDKKNKNIARLVKTDQNLLINKLVSKIKSTSVTNENLGLHLFAINAVYTLDKAMNDYKSYKKGFSNRTEKYVDELRNQIKKKSKKHLKKNFRAIYEEVYKNEAKYTPFNIN